MKWADVAENWSSFFEVIQDRWPEAEESELEEIDGDQRAFIAYIAELEGVEPADAREEVREWLASEIPADVLMGAGGGDDDEDEDDEDDAED